MSVNIADLVVLLLFPSDTVGKDRRGEAYEVVLLLLWCAEVMNI
jgi:hypothetical protein